MHVIPFLLVQDYVKAGIFAYNSCTAFRLHSVHVLLVKVEETYYTEYSGSRQFVWSTVLLFVCMQCRCHHCCVQSDVEETATAGDIVGWLRDGLSLVLCSSRRKAVGSLQYMSCNVYCQLCSIS